MIKEINTLGNWLKRIPYENLSKRLSRAPRDSGRLIDEHRARGHGGTCFSLVNAAAYQAKQSGLTPLYFLGDRPDGTNRHCVLGFKHSPYFLDPGYLCFEPLPLHPGPGFLLIRPHNILHLSHSEPDRLRMETERHGQKTWRYTLNTRPVSRKRFERAWEDSFGWYSVMNSVVLTRLREDDMICYLNGKLESVALEERTTLTTPDQKNDAEFLSELFQIDERLIREWDLKIQPS